MEKNLEQKVNTKSDKNIDLIELAQNGDKQALDQITEKNLPLVASVCKKFLNRGYEYEDIFQIGCIGLVKAVNNFDPKFKVKFSTYAVPMIMGEIRRFIRDDGIVKVSRSIKNTARKLYYAKEELTTKLKREPTIEELSQYTEIDKEEIILALESSIGPQYLYDTIHQEEGSPVLLIDKLDNKGEKEEDVVDKIVLKEVLRDLDYKARQVIFLRYFKDKTQIQVAKVLGISQVQVSRIEKKVLQQMREKLSG